MDFGFHTNGEIFSTALNTSLDKVRVVPPSSKNNFISEPTPSPLIIYPITNYVNFCVSGIFIIWEVETSRIVYNRNPDPDSTTQNELFFLLFRASNIRAQSDY